MQLFKVGTFFMMVGSVILLLFFFAAKAGVDQSAGLLFGGLITFALGAFLWFRFPKPPPESSGRFRILKKGRGKPQRPRWEEEEEEDQKR
ncbi:MAG TPA: hypothetical protein VN364_08010 [Bellilinea sp.]|nr:hypothetical protein [Bellilinea sp.]